MSAFTKHYNNLGIKNFILNADFENFSGKKFYEHLGYKKREMVFVKFE